MNATAPIVGRVSPHDFRFERIPPRYKLAPFGFEKDDQDSLCCFCGDVCETEVEFTNRTVDAHPRCAEATIKLFGYPI